LITVILLSTALLLSCSGAKTGSPGDPESSSSESVRSLTIHYYRYVGDYSGWNVWVWPSDPNGDGTGHEFGAPDRDGFVTARVVLPAAAEVKEFGMIIRKK